MRVRAGYEGIRKCEVQIDKKGERIMDSRSQHISDIRHRIGFSLSRKKRGGETSNFSLSRVQNLLGNQSVSA